MRPDSFFIETRNVSSPVGRTGGFGIDTALLPPRETCPGPGPPTVIVRAPGSDKFADVPGEMGAPVPGVAGAPVFGEFGLSVPVAAPVPVVEPPGAAAIGGEMGETP